MPGSAHSSGTCASIARTMVEPLEDRSDEHELLEGLEGTVLGERYQLERRLGRAAWGRCTWAGIFGSGGRWP